MNAHIYSLIRSSTKAQLQASLGVSLAMRHVVRVVVVLLLVVLASAASAGAVAHHRKVLSLCPQAHSRAVVADGQAEVYLAPEEAALPEFLGFYGCSFAHKRSYLLGSPPQYSSSGGSGIELVTLSGPMAAFESSSARTGYGKSWLIVVRDLRDGKVVHSVPTGTSVHPGPPRVAGGIIRQDVGIGPAESIVVKRDGAVAWIAQDAVEGELPYEYQVHALDRSGSRVLADGADVEPSSLALAGSRLYWSEGGKPFSAALN